MKIRIKTYNGELPSYLTVGKVYKLWKTSDMWSRATYADDGSILQISHLNNCHHLNGGSWEMVNE